MGYETESWREPKVREDESVIASEHGRITHNIDYRSHWFVLTRGAYKHHYLYVKHGGGEERMEMPGVNFEVTARVILSQDSDTRYLLLHHLYDIHRDARTDGRNETAATYRKAFVDGTLKKRKLPSQGKVKVWIEASPIVKSGETTINLAEVTR